MAGADSLPAHHLADPACRLTAAEWPIASLRLILFATLSALFISSQPIHAEEKKVELCGMDWPPHASTQLKNDGYAMQVIREAFALEGYTVTKQWQPWKRALEDSKRSLCLLQEVSFSSERLEWFWFSTPYSSDIKAIFVKADNTLPYKSLKDLEAREVGYLRGGQVSPEFANAGNLKKSEVNDYRSGVQMLAAGRFDAFAGGRMAILYEARQLGLEKAIKQVGPPLVEDFLHLAASNKSPENLETLAAFNRGLFKLMRNGRYAQIMREQGY